MGASYSEDGPVPEVSGEVQPYIAVRRRTGREAVGDTRCGAHYPMKAEYKIIGVSILFGLFLWVIDAALDSLLFYEGTFWQLLILDVPRLDLYLRLLMLGCFVVIGLLVAVLLARRRRVEEALREREEGYRNLAAENARLLEQAQQDAETKATLLREVNHRVQNNLTAIISLLYGALGYANVKNQATFRSTIHELIGRVHGLATVHNMLSAAGWTNLQLSDLAAQVIQSASQALPRQKQVSVDVAPSPVRVTSQQAHNLALVINELATNSVKYALRGRTAGRISLHISLDSEVVHCDFRDDGPGFPEDVLSGERGDVGFDLIQGLVRDGLRGELSLRNDGGAVATIRFPV